MKQFFTCSMLLVVALLPVPAMAATATNEESGVVVTIPDTAVEGADHVFSLGTAIDPKTKKTVEGFAIVDYKNEHAQSSTNAATSPTSSCYGYLAKSTKWKTVEPWVMNPTNTRGLDGTTAFNTVAAAIAKWKDATDGTVGNNAGISILGSGSQTTNALTVETSAPDGTNEVLFGEIADSNAIAVTTVWGIFSGSLSQRKLVEWDMVFDQVDFDWSLTGEASKMDFENIVTHELGHATGLADLYSGSCAEETMYGYASEGETKKRSLNTGDITGINKLY